MKIKAYTAEQERQILVEKTYLIDSLKSNELLVKVTHCGVCRSDAHFIDNNWGDSQFPLVPGHEIVGTVEDSGTQSTFVKGQRVGISWQQGACLNCEWCNQQKEEYCPALKAVCLGQRGGFADYLITDSRFVFSLPDQLDSASVAPLLCAGATAYHALTSFAVKPGMQVAVIGIGGLGHLAIQFAKALGCHVTALDLFPEKFSDAKRLGADACCSSMDKHELVKLAGRFDFILSATDAELDYDAYLDALKPEGKFCFIGMPAQKIAISVFKLIIGQKSICASPLGSRQSIQAMLEFAVKHNIRPQVELMPMSQVNDALAKVRDGKAKYRVVLYN